MRKILLITAFLPLALFAQNQAKVASSGTRPAGGFLIEASITGFPNGTPVSFLNGNTGAPEMNTTVENNMFSFSGNLTSPDFKLILFNNKPPYITLFLDNSTVKISGKSDSVQFSQVTGSQSHNDFIELNNIVWPNQQLFTEGNTDIAAKKTVTGYLESYIKSHPGSHLAPLAIYRIFQLMVDPELMEKQFNELNTEIKSSPIGSYVAQQITIAKSSPIMGKPLPDFSMADSAGKMVSLSSMRGKYVLIDFWASWCGPCRMENPNVVATYNKYKNKNYTVLGVSFDKAKQPWIDAIYKDNLTWTHVSDLQGWANAVGQKFKISQIPQNFLVDPNGILIARNLRGSELETKLASLLGNN